MSFGIFAVTVDFIEIFLIVDQTPVGIDIGKKVGCVAVSADRRDIFVSRSSRRGGAVFFGGKHVVQRGDLVLVRPVEPVAVSLRDEINVFFFAAFRSHDRLARGDEVGVRRGFHDNARLLVISGGKRVDPIGTEPRVHDFYVDLFADLVSFKRIINAFDFVDALIGPGTGSQRSEREDGRNQKSPYFFHDDISFL